MRSVNIMVSRNARQEASIQKLFTSLNDETCKIDFFDQTSTIETQIRAGTVAKKFTVYEHPLLITTLTSEKLRSQIRNLNDDFLWTVDEEFLDSRTTLHSVDIATFGKSEMFSPYWTVILVPAGMSFNEFRGFYSTKTARL